jgi:hypothetical protein
MNNNLGTQKPDFTTLAIGAVLVLLGVFFLFVQFVGQIFGFHLGQYLWPFFIILPGLALLLLALFGRARAGEPLAMIGALITMVGLILFFQRVTDWWSSWSYAWALVAPTSLGLGQMAYGLVKGQPAIVRSGTKLATIGFILFLAFGFFFELIIGINGFGLGRWAWSVFLIGLGVLMLLRAILPGRRNLG